MIKPTRLGNYSVEVTIGTCPPLKDEYKLRTCPDESELEFETCGVAPIHITPKFTKSAQTINFSATKIVENPSKGVVTINTVKGIITYTPNKGQKGYDEFKYIIYGSDKFEDSEIVTVKILINELIVNNATVYACNVNGKGIFDLSDANGSFLIAFSTFLVFCLFFVDFLATIFPHLWNLTLLRLV